MRGDAVQCAGDAGISQTVWRGAESPPQSVNRVHSPNTVCTSRPWSAGAPTTGKQGEFTRKSVQPLDTFGRRTVRGFAPESENLVLTFARNPNRSAPAFRSRGRLVDRTVGAGVSPLSSRSSPPPSRNPRRSASRKDNGLHSGFPRSRRRRVFPRSRSRRKGALPCIPRRESARP